MRSFVSVNQLDVFVEMWFLFEAFPAFLTTELPLLTVVGQVMIQVNQRRKTFAAQETKMVFDSLMGNFHMFVTVRFREKAHMTYGAFVGTNSVVFVDVGTKTDTRCKLFVT